MDKRYSAAAGAAGTISIPVRPTGTRPWVVTQVSVELVAGSAAAVGAAATGMLRKNGAPVAPFVAHGDAVAGDPPIRLGTTDEMTIEWAGANNGNIGVALLIYELG